MAELRIDVDDHTPIGGFRVGGAEGGLSAGARVAVWRVHRTFLHEVECQLPGELDETVVSSFRHDENRLYL